MRVPPLLLPAVLDPGSVREKDHLVSPFFSQSTQGEKEGSCVLLPHHHIVPPFPHCGIPKVASSRVAAEQVGRAGQAGKWGTEPIDAKRWGQLAGNWEELARADKCWQGLAGTGKDWHAALSRLKGEQDEHERVHGRVVCGRWISFPRLSRETG